MRKPIVVVAVLVLVLFSGCAKKEKLSKAEYIRKGDAICKKANNRMKALDKRVETAFQDLASPEKLKGSELSAVFEESLEVREDELEQTRELGEIDDAGDQRKMKSILEQRETELKKTSEIVRRMSRKSGIAVLEELAHLEDVSSAAAELTDFGFKECGNGW